MISHRRPTPHRPADGIAPALSVGHIAPQTGRRVGCGTASFQAFVVDDHVKADGAAAFKGQRQVQSVAVVDRLGQAHQHDVIAPPGKGVAAVRGDDHAVGQCGHRHHTICVHHAGVQHGHLGGVGGDGHQAIFGGIGVGYGQEHRAGRARAAPVGIGDLHLRQCGKGDQGQRCGQKDLAFGHGCRVLQPSGKAKVPLFCATKSPAWTCQAGLL